MLIAIVLFPRHLSPQRRAENISHIQTFRDYFHYHIKASKVRFNIFCTWIAIANPSSRHTYILECDGEPQTSFKVNSPRIEILRMALT